MRLFYLFLCMFISAISNSTFADDENPYPPLGEIHTFHHQAAVISNEPIEDTSFYIDLRRNIYEKYSLRIIRVIHRITGIKLDHNTTTSFFIPFASLISACLCFLVGYVRRHIMLRMYGFGMSFIFIFIFSLYLLSGLVALNQFDYRDNRSSQKMIDTLIYNGIPFKTYERWDSFTEVFDRSLKEGELPHTLILWTGMPRELENEKINKWLHRIKGFPIAHLTMGPHLPSQFHQTLFPKKKPKLAWLKPEEASVCDKSTAYYRQVSWRNTEGFLPFRKQNWEKHSILYADASVTSEEFHKETLSFLKQDSNFIYFRPDLDKKIMLRMDDPGASQNVHHESWIFPELSTNKWTDIEKILKANAAKLSVGYVMGWQDDGDSNKGDLYITNKKIENRKPVKAFPSPDTRYYHKETQQWYEYEKQFEFLKNSNTFELELHGHTHVTPHIEQWLQAKDSFTNYNWYREFLKTEFYPDQQQDLEAQKNIISAGLKLFADYKLPKPWVLIPPGQKISYDTTSLLSEFELPLLSDKSVNIAKGERYYRSNLIPTYDLRLNEEKSATTRTQGFTLMLHDKDIHDLGTTWLQNKLLPFKENNFEFITLKELALRLSCTPTIRENVKEKSIDILFNLSNRLKAHMQNKSMQLTLINDSGKTFNPNSQLSIENNNSNQLIKITLNPQSLKTKASYQ